MNTQKYFFKESTNIKLSDGICQVLSWDCHNFNYFKNDTCNFSGLLNRLIPELSAYRDDLHKKFLAYNHYDENITRQIEDSIYNVYIKTFDISDSSFINVPFRINKRYTDEFTVIYEQKLKKYGLDFTNYVRTLLCEYSVKPYYQRELFFFYRFVDGLKQQIKEQKSCYYVLDNKFDYFIPIAIELSPKQDNYIVGILTDMQTPIHIPLVDADKIRFLDNYYEITEEAYDIVAESWEEFIAKETDD